MEGAQCGGSAGEGAPKRAKPLNWGILYAELRYSLGYTTAQIDDMIWQDYIDLHAYWKKHPPTHILAAGFMGYKEPAEVDPNANQDMAWEQLMSIFPVKIVPKSEMSDVG